MDDFVERSGQNLQFAETWHITESEIERVLWHNTHTDEPVVDNPKDIYNKLLHLKKREVDLDLHGLFLSDYFRSKKIPRGFRIKNVPTIGRQNPDFCRKWIGVLNRCSLDLMVLVIEEVGSEIVKVRKELASLETAHQTLINDTTFTELHRKLKSNVENFRMDLLRFKRDKLRKVEEDYLQHRVYRWLGGGGGTGGWRGGVPKWRKQRGRALSTIDSSGDSGEEDVTSVERTEAGASGTQSSQRTTGSDTEGNARSVHFHEDPLPTDRGPMDTATILMSTRNNNRSGRNAPGGARGGRGRPPKYPK
ncbi:hypothetical protein XELAEV_18033554mg [Xenopus laevis]|uniref:Uncharacterized protein n=1 Tax=Xenopus laevis TaxID=8355 RepID=A0A974HE29_XENLA|nr:hypothetical protein XELAEV_18033554mg [Xenopus laevis]